MYLNRYPLFGMLWSSIPSPMIYHETPFLDRSKLTFWMVEFFIGSQHGIGPRKVESRDSSSPGQARWFRCLSHIKFASSSCSYGRRGGPILPCTLSGKDCRGFDTDVPTPGRDCTAQGAGVGVGAHGAEVATVAVGTVLAVVVGSCSRGLSPSRSHSIKPPNHRCWTTTLFPSTSASYIFHNPPFTFFQPPWTPTAIAWS